MVGCVIVNARSSALYIRLTIPCLFDGFAVTSWNGSTWVWGGCGGWPRQTVSDLAVTRSTICILLSPGMHGVTKLHSTALASRPAMRPEKRTAAPPSVAPRRPVLTGALASHRTARRTCHEDESERMDSLLFFLKVNTSTRRDIYFISSSSNAFEGGGAIGSIRRRLGTGRTHRATTRATLGGGRDADGLEGADDGHRDE